MSHAASNYVKKLITAPNGEPVTFNEKGILWYIADSHNDEQRAAWCGVPILALHNNISPRRVREILAECIRKRIIWREERLAETGRTQSNWWRFTALDGEPSTEALVAEEKRRLRGGELARFVNDKKRQKISTENGEGGCDISHPYRRHLAGGRMRDLASS